VQLSDEVLLEMKTTAIGMLPNECGGILIGRYQNELMAAIVEHTSINQDSKSGQTWFYRGIKGLKNLLLKHWKDGHYYIGEWHSHPYGSCNPSSTDLESLAQISVTKTAQCNTPILLIIGGYSGSMDEILITVYEPTMKNYHTLKQVH
jgi:integrative and conjugative element protein (TIGR02256 family)